MHLKDLCRDFEKKFPLSPDHWYQAQQYKVSHNVIQLTKNAWSLGIGKDARHERWIRIQNENCKFHCFDPTPISKATIKDNNWAVDFYMLKKKKSKNVNLLQYHNFAYHRSGRKQHFYTHDPKMRCFSMYSSKLGHRMKVQSITFENMIIKAGVPDYIKFDIEGMWFEFCEDLFKHNLKVAQINGEFEMNYDNHNLAFDKLNTVVDMFESQGYKIYCNRKLDTWNIELSFIKPELV